MITSVKVINYLGESMTIDLTKPEISGFVVVSIEGLGPGKAILNTTEQATSDGSILNSSRLPARNIVMTFLYECENYDDIEILRQKTYRYFPLKQQVTLIFKTNTREAEIVGTVESDEPTIFSKTTGAQVSILCPDPYFYESGATSIMVTELSSISPSFEFPFGSSLMTFGTRNLVNSANIVYKGDVDIGALIRLHAIGSVTGKIQVKNDANDKITIIDTARISGGILVGDDIHINTVRGHKYVHLIRAGETTNILNAWDRTSDWVTLVKGSNLVSYDVVENTSGTGVSNLRLKIENKTVYSGL